MRFQDAVLNDEVDLQNPFVRTRLKAELSAEIVDLPTLQRCHDEFNARWNNHTSISSCAVCCVCKIDFDNSAYSTLSLPQYAPMLAVSPQKLSAYREVQRRAAIADRTPTPGVAATVTLSALVSHCYNFFEWPAASGQFLHLRARFVDVEQQTFSACNECTLHLLKNSR